VEGWAKIRLRLDRQKARERYRLAERPGMRERIKAGRLHRGLGANGISVLLRVRLKIRFHVRGQDARFVRACSRNGHARNHCLGGIVEEVFTCFRRAADVKRLKGSRVHRMSRNLKD